MGVGQFHHALHIDAVALGVASLAAYIGVLVGGAVLVFNRRDFK